MIFDQNRISRSENLSAGRDLGRKYEFICGLPLSVAKINHKLQLENRS